MACSDTGQRGYECELRMDGVLVAAARDVTPSFTAAKMDATSRASGGWNEANTGRKELTCSIDALWVPNNEAIQRIEQAMRANEVIAFSIIDSYGEGWDGCCVVTQFGPSPRSLDDNVGLSIDWVSTGYVRKICGNSEGGSAVCGSTYGSWGSGSGQT